MSFPQGSGTVTGRVLIPCVCSGSSGWCGGSSSGYVWVQRETEGEREGTRVKTIWLAGHEPSPTTPGPFLPLLQDNSLCLPREGTIE